MPICEKTPIKTIRNDDWRVMPIKWRLWIGGVLLVVMLFGIPGCGEKREPAGGHMVDGPGMMNTPADQSPFAGTWHSADEG